jgi:hypothetical protein
MAGLPPLLVLLLAMWDMMAGGDAALIEEWQRGSVEAAWARIFSIDGVVVVASSACS